MDDSSQNESISSEQDKKVEINNLILSGGGIKGMFYPGFFDAINENPDIFKIRKIIAISIGAPGAVLYSVGFKTFEFEKIFSAMNPENHLSFDFYNFMESWGIASTEEWQKLCRNAFLYKTGLEKCTFAEHFKMTGIHLILPLSCISKQQLEIFDYINTPDIDIFDVLKASFAIPLLFHPVKIGNKLYCDAGVIDNRCNFLINESEIDRTLLVDFNWEINSKPKNIFEYFALLLGTTLNFSHIPTSLKNLRFRTSADAGGESLDFKQFPEMWRKYIPEGYKQSIDFIRNNL